jgi:hypothetical protein
MEEKPVQQRILFYYDEENKYDYTQVYTCSSYKINSGDNIINFIKELHELEIKIFTKCLHDKFSKFIKGTLVIGNKEFNILDFNLYYYLQIEEKMYCRIGICKLDKEIFIKIKNLEKIKFRKD